MFANGEVLRTLSESRERYWWQSRHNMRDPPKLADLSTLARQVRNAFGQQPA